MLKSHFIAFYLTVVSFELEIQTVYCLIAFHLTFLSHTCLYFYPTHVKFPAINGASHIILVRYFQVIQAVTLTQEPPINCLLRAKL